MNPDALLRDRVCLSIIVTVAPQACLSGFHLLRNCWGNPRPKPNLSSLDALAKVHVAPEACPGEAHSSRWALLGVLFLVRSWLLHLGFCSHTHLLLDWSLCHHPLAQCSPGLTLLTGVPEPRSQLLVYENSQKNLPAIDGISDTSKTAAS